MVNDDVKLFDKWGVEKREYTLEEILIKRNTVVTYNDLVRELKKDKLSPEEIYNLIIKAKLKDNKINVRTEWMLQKIDMYLERRKFEAFPILMNQVQLISSKGGVVLYRDKITTLKKIVKDRGLMPSKKKSCENTVNSDQFMKRWKLYNDSTKIKWDPRKETQNLQKIVTEKKFNKWFNQKHHRTIDYGLWKYKINIKGKEQRLIDAIR